MKEVIIVAGDKQLDVGSIRACLGHMECTTVPCETAEEIVETAEKAVKESALKEELSELKKIAEGSEIEEDELETDKVVSD